MISTYGLVELINSQDRWGQRSNQMQADKRVIRMERVKLQKQIDGLLDRIVEADSPSIITAYEKRIEKMKREKPMLGEKLSKQRPKRFQFGLCL